ncbi:prolyl oligopeptidase family serine peptidase [Candidatus Amesbacteria bacterium]|nr:prolyl oligopeptidase family serine peptidase [Candidatus Amesbacteria bacterium]
MKLFSVGTVVALGSVVVVTALFLAKNKSVGPAKLLAYTVEEATDANSKVIVKVEYDVAYGDLPKQKLDLCRPQNIGGKVPAVMLVHGGGGDKKDFTSICKSLAQNGLVAAAVNYREDPPPTYKVVLGDNRAALAWLKAKSYVEPNKIGYWGGSQGGYVSSVAGTDERPDKVQCVNNNYGATDFTDPSEWEGSALPDEVAERFFGGVTYEEDPELYRDLSPVIQVSANDAKKWLLTRSTNDQLVPRTQMTKMMDALQAAGLQAEFYEYEGKGSGHANQLGPAQAKKLLQKRMNFMTGCLKGIL